MSKLSSEAKEHCNLLKRDVLAEIMSQKIEQEKIDPWRLSKYHLDLLKAAYWRYEDCEFGAPAMDCKRPYGNSDVITDIREITESTASSDDLIELHESLCQALWLIFQNPDVPPVELIGEKLK